MDIDEHDLQQLFALLGPPWPWSILEPSFRV